jgi:hypothetical protein
MSSILNDTKKALGLDPAYTAFDVDLVMHINSVLATVRDLGIGPSTGFSIADSSETWEDLIGTDVSLNDVKTYIYLKVRQIFDPPPTSFEIEAVKELVREIEWRLNVRREEESWVDPESVTS